MTDKSKKTWNKLFPSCNAEDFDTTVCKNRKRPPEGIDCLSTCCGVCPGRKTCKVSCSAPTLMDHQICPHYLGQDRKNDPNWEKKAAKVFLQF